MLFYATALTNRKTKSTASYLKASSLQSVKVLAILLGLITCYLPTLKAQIIYGTYDFTSFAAGTLHAQSTATSASWDIPVSSTNNAPSGLTAVVEGDGTGGSIRIINSALSSDIFLTFNRTGTTTAISKAILKSSAGGEFKLSSIELAPNNANSQTLTVIAMRNGVQVGNAITEVFAGTPIASRNIDLSSNVDFATIDAIEISTTELVGLRIDDIVIQPAAALPVVFGNISATANDGILNIEWSTESEVNNDHFDIELSPDGKNFIKLTSVESKAHNGNSDQKVEYNFKIEKSKAISLISGSLALALVCFGFRFKRKTNLFVLSMFVFGAIACTKRNASIDEHAKKYLFV
ncbi:hypothetical protein [Niabella ginsengisoli]|uniref:Uncharacterized protein n=1 Tax=Niabella ginsengisoli TaxID=522298 RepID=A0ABS9SMA6_9BACT|nr:hypothetical protein [Niabella ginsengisoli]MCH5596421.1 hypothetical protein [Niabella ginsengisoli]MCH5599492.1 hypothetical protein [Niabella ginsengisoli]